MTKDNEILDEFINDEETQNEEACDCNTEECRIKSRKGDLVERISKKLIVEDGRELLI